MILNLITPDKAVIQKNSLDFIHLHLSNGYPISIYPGHANLIALISDGRVEYRDDTTTHKYFTSDGLVIIKDDIVSCYVNWADSEKNRDDDGK